MGPRPLELASILWGAGEMEERLVASTRRGVEPREKGMYVPRLVGLPRPLVSEMCMSCLIQNVCLSKRDCKAIEPQNLHNETHTNSFSQDMFIKHLLVAKHTGRHSGGKNKRSILAAFLAILSVLQRAGTPGSYAYLCKPEGQGEHTITLQPKVRKLLHPS